MRTAVLVVVLLVVAACAGSGRDTGAAESTAATDMPATTTTSTAPTVPTSTALSAPSTSSTPTTSTPTTTPPATAPTSPPTTPPPTTSTPTTPPPATTVASGPVGRSDGTLRTPDGRTRTYHLYVPRGLDPAGAPLLVALHGGTGSGRQFETTSGFDALADRHRFVVVYPDGVGAGSDETSFRTWNAGICCGPAVRKGVDDVDFIRRLIDEVDTQFRIDPDRVYAAGHSNGGFLAYRLACELADRVVAVGLQAGGLGVPQCAPSRPVSLLHIHGTADTNVPIAGGRGSGISGVSWPPLDQSLATVAQAMGCTEMTGPTIAGRVSTTTWQRADGSAVVERRLVDGEPHRWIRSADVDAAVAIVDFLLAHPRA